MAYPEHVSARFTGPVPDGMIPKCAEYLREAELPVQETATGLTVEAPQARLELQQDPSGLSLSLDAADRATLQGTREYLLYLFDSLLPGADSAMEWSGRFDRNTAPSNLHLARVHGVERVAPHFLRVELACAGTETLARGPGMHFSLLLPPLGRPPVWPVLDGNGRTVMAEGEDSLHRAVYTFVDFDRDAGRFTFDVFEHDGGRTTEWARKAAGGEAVAIMGPGGGSLPEGDRLMMAGDETALPAIRRILEQSAPDRAGDVVIEVGSRADICTLPVPAGMTLSWAVRDEGGTLWDHLQDWTVPAEASLWIAAEKALVRKARARFRDAQGVGRERSYLAMYWTA